MARRVNCPEVDLAPGYGTRGRITFIDRNEMIDSAATDRGMKRLQTLNALHIDSHFILQHILKLYQSKLKDTIFISLYYIK